jgi:ABC-type glutathione transport system ATPase component
MNPRLGTWKRAGDAARRRSMTEEAKPIVEPVVVSNDELPNAARSAAPAIRVEGVTKRFGTTQAIAGVDLEVPEGTVFGLLGPNGAGKTTLVRILSTLLAPDAGRAEVLGHDVGQEPGGVREMIALTGQFAAVDEMLTGRENLELVVRRLGPRACPLALAGVLAPGRETGRCNQRSS